MMMLDKSWVAHWNHIKGMDTLLIFDILLIKGQLIPKFPMQQEPEATVN